MRIYIKKLGQNEIIVTSYLDLFKDENLKIQYKKEITEQAGVEGIKYTYSFNIPATDRNRMLLSNYGIIDTAHNINPAIYIDAILDFDSFQIRGKIEMHGFVKKNNKVLQYQLTFVSNELQIFKELAEFKINEIDFSGFNYYLTYSNVIDSWHLDTSKYVYLPIYSFALDYVWQGNTVASNNIAASAGMVMLKDIRPAYRLNNILTRIFEKAGYNLIISGRLNSDYINDYTFLLWLGGDYATGIADVKQRNRFEIAGGFWLYSDTVITDNEISFKYDSKGRWANDRYYVQVAGDYTFRITADGYGEDIKIQMEDGGGNIVETAVFSGQHTEDLTLNSVPATSYIRFKVIKISGTNQHQVNFDFTLWDAPYTEINELIEAKNLIGDIEAVEFVRQILKYFNAVLITDEQTKSVEMVNIIDYYEAGEELDWTQYVTKEIIQYQKLDFTKYKKYKHATSEDKYATTYKSFNGKEFGELTVNRETDINKSKDEFETDFLILTNDVMLKLDSNGDPYDRTNLTVHTRYNKDGDVVNDDKYVILKVNTDQPQASTAYYMQQGLDSQGNPVAVQKTEFSFYSFYDKNGVGLNFSQEFDRMQVGYSVIGNTLYRNLFEHLEKVMTDRDGYISTVEIKLPAGKIKTIKGNENIIIFGVRHIIKSMKLDAETGMANVELIKYKKEDIL